MKPRYLRKLPPPVVALVADVESHCGRAVDVVRNPRLFTCGGDGYEVLAQVSVHIGASGALETLRIEIARDFSREDVTHEALHLKYMLLDGAPRTRYLDALGEFRDPYGLGINLGDRIEHAALYREMEALGFANGKWTPGAGVRGIVARALCNLERYPSGIVRRAVGLLSWVQVQCCFSELSDMAAGVLREHCLLADAERLMSGFDVGNLAGNRAELIMCCADGIGIPRSNIELRAFERTAGAWTVRRWRIKPSEERGTEVEQTATAGD